MSNIDRKLATVRRIMDLRPIPGADRIETAIIDGWEVIVTKGDFIVDDLCIYFEIDSFLPVRPEYEFLRKNCFKSTMHLGDGFRLRTMKMKKQISQGLALPYGGSLCINSDLTEALGIKKWEKPDFNVNKPLAGGRARGSFPLFLRRTDQERVQNYDHVISRLDPDTLFEVTLKLDGSSMTVFSNNGEIGVCSRNINLQERDREPWLERCRQFGELLRLPAGKLDRLEEKLDYWKCRLFGGRPGLVKQQSVFWHVARSQGLIDVLKALGQNIALQGELMGPGVQGNREDLLTHKFFLFDVWDIDAQRYWTPSERINFADKYGVKHTPFYSYLSASYLTVPFCLDQADRPSINNPVAEGVVFKSWDGQTSFKAINNNYLLKEVA